MYACYKLNSLICDIDKLKKYFFYNKKENLKSLVSSFKTIFSAQIIELKVDFKKYFNFNRLNKNNYFKNKLQKERKNIIIYLRAVPLIKDEFEAILKNHKNLIIINVNEEEIYTSKIIQKLREEHKISYNYIFICNYYSIDPPVIEELVNKIIRSLSITISHYIRF